MTPEELAKQKVYRQRYVDKKKDDPAYKAKRSEQQKAYRERHKTRVLAMEKQSKKKLALLHPERETERQRRRRERNRHSLAIRFPPVGERLTGLLMQNEIYAAACAAVSRGLPPVLREDVISDIVMAVLTGELDQDDIASSGQKYLRQHSRLFDDRWLISLDDVDKIGRSRIEAVPADINIWG